MFKRGIVLFSCLFLSTYLAEAKEVESGDNSVCVRHVYNKSTATWFIVQRYENEFNRWVEGPQIMLSPGKNAELRYAVGYKSQEIHITGPTYDKAFGLAFPHPGFSPRNKITNGVAELLGDCAYIKHDGSTGAAVLNEPSSGDVTLIYPAAEHHKTVKPVAPLTRLQVETKAGCPKGWASWIRDSSKQEMYDKCMGLFRPWMFKSGGMWSGTEPPGWREPGS